MTSKPLHLVHEEVLTPSWDTKVHCSCGDSFSRRLDLLTHVGYYAPSPSPSPLHDGPTVTLGCPRCGAVLEELSLADVVGLPPYCPRCAGEPEPAPAPPAPLARRSLGDHPDPELPTLPSRGRLARVDPLRVAAPVPTGEPAYAVLAPHPGLRPASTHGFDVALPRTDPHRNCVWDGAVAPEPASGVPLGPRVGDWWVWTAPRPHAVRDPDGRRILREVYVRVVDPAYPRPVDPRDPADRAWALVRRDVE